MQYTTNYHLAKPEGTDPVDISVLNNNADIIDTALAQGGGGQPPSRTGMRMIPKKPVM